MKENNLTNFSQVFSQIYDRNSWGRGSGPGSSPENTKSYRIVLQHHINDKSNIQSIVDLGCGDWQIMSLIQIPENKKYLGLDVVPSVIERNKAEYRKENVDFQLIQDLSEIPSGDLLIVKDVIQHWPNEQIHEFVKTVLPKFKYALITNCFQAHWGNLQGLYNQDIQIGDYRPIDLTDAPFNLGNMELYLEYKGGGDKRTYLWTNSNKAEGS